MPLRARIVRQSWSTGRLGCAHRYGDTGHKIGNVAVLIGDQTEHPRAVPVRIRPDLLSSP
jgi:hypothetical protein